MRFSALTFATAIALTIPALAVDQGTQPTNDPTTIDLTPSKVSAPPMLDTGPTVREGTHYVDRTGRLSHSPNGLQAILTFDDGQATRTPSMIVLQNLNLFSMESVLAIKGPGLQFMVSGTVAEYKGHNYILLDRVQTTRTVIASPRAVAGPTSTTASVSRIETTQIAQTTPSTIAATGISSQEEKMKELLTPPPTGGQPLPPPASSDIPATDRSTGTAAVAPAAPELFVIREGTHLINRVGRLSHTPDGHQAILTFDADGKTMKDPPMVILPNMKLEYMENAVTNRATDIHFRISGTITEYKGRNFIQIDKSVMMPDVETQF